MAHGLRAEACSLADAEARAVRGDQRAVECGVAVAGAQWDGVRCLQELVSLVLASSCAAAGHGSVAPLLSAEPGSDGGTGPPAAAAPLGAAQPLLESPGAAAR